MYKYFPLHHGKKKTQNRQTKETVKRKEKLLLIYHLGNLVLPKIHDLVNTAYQLAAVIKLCGTNVFQKIAKVTPILHQSPCHMALKSLPTLIIALSM